MATTRRRPYDSTKRAEAADARRLRVLKAARALFSRHGIDNVTISQIAEKADVSAPTVYALFKSKDGILQAIMRDALFGPHFQAARKLMDNVKDGPKLVALTAKVARAIYESESQELGLMRGASAFSPALRRIEQQFEDMRYDMQEARLKLLFDQGKAKAGLDLTTARRIMWMYTSREIYRMLVHDGGWTAQAYEAWLETTLCEALVKSAG
jgi:AcrR family transcriptional regulator